MFGTVLAEYRELAPAALHAEIERLELEARALDARRFAARALPRSLVRSRRWTVTSRQRPIYALSAISRRRLLWPRCAAHGSVETSQRSVRP